MSLASSWIRRAHGRSEVTVIRERVQSATSAKRVWVPLFKIREAVRSLGRRLTALLLGPTPQPWPRRPVVVPPGLLTGAGLPRHAPAHQEQLRDFRLQRPHEVAWTRTVERQRAASLREWLLRRVIDLRLRQLRIAARRVSRPRQRRWKREAWPLKADVRACGLNAGLNAVGVAAYDERWQFEGCEDHVRGGRMIVAAVEQDYRRMQVAPDREYLLTAGRAYVRLLQGAIEIAHALRAAGHEARIYERDGGAMTLPYAIAAGLGQLGMNGQVLTPEAGSRVRMMLISTDAPLRIDRPVDFGIPGICKRCGICASRCPVGAIPLREREDRGVKKWKVKTDRCLPMVAQANGCAVCIKTCPIQRFGLGPVLDHYRLRGEILGRGTDLERYRWPLDGESYPSGKRPRLLPVVRRPPALEAARRADGHGPHGE